MKYFLSLSSGKEHVGSVFKGANWIGRLGLGWVVGPTFYHIQVDQSHFLLPVLPSSYSPIPIIVRGNTSRASPSCGELQYTWVQCVTKWSRSIGSKAKTCRPMRKAFSTTVCSTCNVKMPSNSDKAVVITAPMRISLAAAGLTNTSCTSSLFSNTAFNSSKNQLADR